MPSYGVSCVQTPVVPTPQSASKTQPVLSLHLPPQTGHGMSVARPLNTCALRLAVMTPSPRSGLAVPVMSCEKRLDTHTGVPLAVSGNGVPNQQLQTAPPLQSGPATNGWSHSVRMLFAQRQLPGSGLMPVTVHSPQPGVAGPSQTRRAIAVTPSLMSES